MFGMRCNMGMAKLELEENVRIYPLHIIVALRFIHMTWIYMFSCRIFPEFLITFYLANFMLSNQKFWQSLIISTTINDNLRRFVSDI